MRHPPEETKYGAGSSCLLTLAAHLVGKENLGTDGTYSRPSSRCRKRPVCPHISSPYFPYFPYFQKTGSDFEGVFANHTQTSRQTFDIPNRDGIVPDAPVKINVQGVAELEAFSGIRKPTGELVFQPKVLELPPANGKKVTRGIFINDDVAAEKFASRRRARGENINDSGEKLVPKDVVIQAVSTQTLEFAFTPEAKRTAAKCALVALAHQYGIDYA